MKLIFNVALLCIFTHFIANSWEFDFKNNSRLGVDIGPRFPIGKTGNWASTGGGLNLNYSYNIVPEFSVGFSIGAERWGNKNNNENNTWTFTTAPVMVNANFHPTIFDCGFTPFLGFGFGPAFWWDCYEYKYGNMTQSGSETGTDFGFKFYGGSTYRATSCLELLLGLSYSSYDSEPENVNNLGLYGGIKFNF